MYETQYKKFPCDKCLVYVPCNKICQKYYKYIELCFRCTKYKCFEIVPPMPQHIKELCEIINRVEEDKYRFTYYTYKDFLDIRKKSDKVIIATIQDIRKQKTIKFHPDFPEDFR